MGSNFPAIIPCMQESVQGEKIKGTNCFQMEENFHEYQIEQLMTFKCIHENFIISNFALLYFGATSFFPRLQCLMSRARGSQILYFIGFTFL